MKNKTFMSKLSLMISMSLCIVLLLMLLILLDIFNQPTESNQQIIILSGCMSLVLILSVARWWCRRFVRKIQRLFNVCKQLSKNLCLAESEMTMPENIDEIDEMLLIAETITENLSEISYLARDLAVGNLPVDTYLADKNNKISKNLVSASRQMKQIIKKLDQTLEDRDLIKNSEDGTVLSGNYKTASDKIDQFQTNVNDQADWYLNILDAIPFSIGVTDNYSRWLFINKTLENIAVASGMLSDRDSAYGVIRTCQFNIEGDCYSNGCPDECPTKVMLVTGETETELEINGNYYKMSQSFFYNRHNEQIGFVSTSMDITPMMSVNDYSKKEILRLEENLRKLAEGDLNLEMNLREPGMYTLEISKQFDGINQSLYLVKRTIDHLIDDITAMITAMIEGKLDARADENKFDGIWKKLIGGMNDILQEIDKPLFEVGKVMEEISTGNLSVSVNGDYQGAFDHFKQVVNLTLRQLNMVIDEISGKIQEIARGNLNLEDAEEYHGKFAEMSKSINAIIPSLNHILNDIDGAAAQVNVSARQISDGSQSLAQGSTEQASSIQELTASIAEIANQTKNNALDASKVKELSDEVLKNAEIGNSQMVEMQESMEAINGSSQDISKIIKVIDDIAFQTNILALNAAVEAARAGQHGKGFAVVAEEVRTLAARSSEAARETTKLIEGSIDKVKTGTRITNETTDAFGDIVSGIEKVTELIGKIALASNEQATGIAQINTGIDQVAQVVHQNSATAEESAAASEELSAQAEILKERIDRFKLRSI